MELFKIQNLECQYISDKTVLKIENLVLPKSKLVFVLGVSGIGKSTFIETLGLMNKTIAQKANTRIIFAPENHAEVELKGIWDEGDEKLSTFRNNYFSFIFQNTNLMPNLTAGENMCVSQLIQGKTINDAKVDVLKAMAEIGLDKDIFDRKITELSGGQRQRLAFVRAFTAEFEVLFGDEPTGNLDATTSKLLMTLLKTNLQTKGRTGIMVSHDIKLALDFADLIIVVTPKYKDKTEKKIDYGIIDTKHVLTQKNGDWIDGDGEKQNAKEVIENIFKKVAK
jgi:putative ABC transport system ATP-binding protein